MVIKKLKSWAAKLKRQAQILQVVYKDDRTPLEVKVLIWLTLGYLFSPIDLIPDFIPILGLLDDIIIVPLMIALVIKLIPKEVMVDAVDSLKDQPSAKWRLNKFIIVLICLVWAFCAYLIFRWGSNYFYNS